MNLRIWIVPLLSIVAGCSGESGIPAAANVDEKQTDDNKKRADRTGAVNNVLHQLVYGDLLGKLGREI